MWELRGINSIWWMFILSLRVKLCAYFLNGLLSGARMFRIAPANKLRCAMQLDTLWVARDRFSPKNRWYGMHVLRRPLQISSAAIFCLWGGIAFAHAGVSPKPGAETVIQTGMGAEIPAEEMSSVINDALSGSAEAANRLVAFARFVTGDQSQQLYWSRIAYENGNKDAALSIGILLSCHTDKSDVRRARFWLLKAEAEGSPDAIEAAHARLASMANDIREAK